MLTGGALPERECKTMIKRLADNAAMMSLTEIVLASYHPHSFSPEQWSKNRERIDESAENPWYCLTIVSSPVHCRGQHLAVSVRGWRGARRCGSCSDATLDNQLL